MRFGSAATCSLLLLQAIVANADLYTTGRNDEGQLGTGDLVRRSVPVLIQGADIWPRDSVFKVAGGQLHTVVIAGNEFYAMGRNENGQLGTGDFANHSRPVRVGSQIWGIGAVQWVAAGDYHTAVVAGSSLYMMGRNIEGQLGTGDNVVRNLPTLVAGPWGSVTQAAGGQSHSAVVADGRLYTAGANANGQLGVSPSRNFFQLVPGAWADQTVTAVALGALHTVILAGGRVYTAGFNFNGQLAIGATGSRFAPTLVNGPWSTASVTAVAAGAQHTLMVAGGKLYAAGSNERGQLGLGSSVPDQFAPQLVNGPWGHSAISAAAAGQLHSVVASVPSRFQASLTRPGSAATGSATVVFNVATGVMEASTSFSGLAGTTTVSHIHCCTATPGTGTAGAATTVPSFPGFPTGVQAGSYSRLFDMLNASSYNPAFITANGGTPASAFQALFNGIFTGRAYWNIHTTVVPGGEISGFLQLAPVINVYGMGYNTLGQLGLGASVTNVSTPTPVGSSVLVPGSAADVGAGSWVTGIVVADSCSYSPCAAGAVCQNNAGPYTCLCPPGFSGFGNVQCTAIDLCAANPCSAGALCTNTPGSVTCSCPSGFTDNGLTGSALICTDIDECAAAVSPCSSAAVCTNTPGAFLCLCPGGFPGNGLPGNLLDCTGGTLFAMGNNFNGQLGTNDTVNRRTPVVVGAGVWPASSVNSASAGTDHVVVVADGNLYVSGRNDSGQLGTANTNAYTLVGVNIWGNHTVNVAAAGAQHTLVVAARSLYAMGNNVNGQLGLGDVTNRGTPTPVSGLWASGTVTAVAAGLQHSLVIAGGFLYGAGGNGNGQLGWLDKTPTLHKTFELALGPWVNGTVTAVTAGDLFTAVIAGGNVYVSGFNVHGQLGIGNANSRFGFVLIGTGIWPAGSATIISAGSQHLAIIADGGKLFTTGLNGQGQLGVNDATDRFAPVLVATAVTDVAAGQQHTLLVSGGDLYTIGSNNVGQAGLGNDARVAVPTLVKSSWANGTVVAVFAGQLTSYVVSEDKCALQPCSPTAVCTNAGTFQCSCPPGFSGNGLTGPALVCTDINECLSSPCSANAICTNTPGSFECSCPNGFNTSGTGATSQCIDIDECAAAVPPCSSSSICINTLGSFTCSCPAGFFGNGLARQSLRCNRGNLYVVGDNLNGQLGTGNFANVRVPSIDVGPYANFSVTAIAGGEQFSVMAAAGSAFQASMTRAGSTATGSATVVFNLATRTMDASASFSGLAGTTTASHIHCCTATPGTGTAGAATTVPSFPGFPNGVQAGSYSRLFDMLNASSYNPSFITANGGTPASAFQALYNGIVSGRAYWNVHTTTFPGGEISGFLQPAAVPHLYVMGHNDAGQLGIGDSTSNVSVPTLVGSNIWGQTPVATAAAGDRHTLVVVGGNLYAMGSNNLGQLGSGVPPFNATTPIVVNSSAWIPQSVVNVAAGQYISAVIAATAAASPAPSPSVSPSPPPSELFAVVRPFAVRDTLTLAASFQIWNTQLPCSASPPVAADLILCFSQNLATNPEATAAVQAVLQEYVQNKGNPNHWAHCFHNAFAISANLAPADDIYDPSHSAQNPDWVKGPNLQFLAMAQGFAAGTWGTYANWYLMEMDSIPKRSSWLTDLQTEVGTTLPFMVLGSFYRGDAWDQFQSTIPEANRLHVNGNAVYNSTNTLLLSFLQVLQAALNSGPLSVAYDVYLAEYFLNQTLTADQFAWLNGDSSVIGNYAHTSMIAAYFNNEAIVHGAFLFDAWQPQNPPIALVVSDFSLTGADGRPQLTSFEENFQLGFNPYRELVEILPPGSATLPPRTLTTNGATGVQNVAVTQATRTTASASLDWCDAQVTSPWFMYTSSNVDFSRRIDLLRAPGTQLPVVTYVPANSTFCDASCTDSIARAAAYSGVTLTEHYDANFMVFDTALRTAFCTSWKAWAAQQVLPAAVAVPAAAPSADDYMAYLVSTGQVGVYDTLDRVVYGQRDVGVGVNGTQCERQPTQATCVAIPTCAWRPGFGTCFTGQLATVLTTPQVVLAQEYALCSADFALPALLISNGETVPLSISLGVTSPFTLPITSASISPQATQSVAVQTSASPPPQSGTITVITTSTSPQLLLTSAFFTVDVRGWTVTATYANAQVTLVASGAPQSILRVPALGLEGVDTLVIPVPVGTSSMNIAVQQIVLVQNVNITKCHDLVVSTAGTVAVAGNLNTVTPSSSAPQSIVTTTNDSSPWPIVGGVVGAVAALFAVGATWSAMRRRHSQSLESVFIVDLPLAERPCASPSSATIAEQPIGGPSPTPAGEWVSIPSQC